MTLADTYAMTEARANFGTLVRRTAHSRERIAITDHGHVAAVLINPQELADLEDALALAEYQAEKATGTLKTGTLKTGTLKTGTLNTGTLKTVTQAEARAMLGLERKA